MTASLDIDATHSARTHAPRYASSIEVRVDVGMRHFRHAKCFPRTSAGWAAAKKLVSRINANGLALRHVASSDHWTRTGAMSGSVQVNRRTCVNFKTFESVSGETAISYELIAPVARSWGEVPVDGATWDLGLQRDYSGRSIEEIKASVEGCHEAIYSCRSFEYWPYKDQELVAALAA